MAKKHVAHGTVLNIGSSPSPLQLVVSVTPPGRVRQEIDGLCLADDFEVPLLGIEQKSEVPATQFWDPGDANHEQLDDAFVAKTELTLQIVGGHADPCTDEFTAQVSKLEPEELTPQNAWRRKVTFIRTSDITRTGGSSPSL
jgi:hypothetical protein